MTSEPDRFDGMLAGQTTESRSVESTTDRLQPPTESAKKSSTFKFSKETTLCSQEADCEVMTMNKISDKKGLT